MATGLRARSGRFRSPGDLNESSLERVRPGQRVFLGVGAKNSSGNVELGLSPKHQ